MLKVMSVGSSQGCWSDPDRKARLFCRIHKGVGLEIFEGSVQKLMTFFPESDFEVFYAAQDSDDYNKFSPNDALPGERFFLVALGKQK
jgi:hypothetical protein